MPSLDFATAAPEALARLERCLGIRPDPSRSFEERTQEAARLAMSKPAMSEPRFLLLRLLMLRGCDRRRN